MSHPFRTSLSILAGLALAGTGAQAQNLIHVLNGPNAGDFLGWANSGLGDVNHDGYDDFVAGAPFADPNGASSGFVRVYSGKDGSILKQWSGQNAGDRFGQTVSDAGDVNNDGTPDILIGVQFFDGLTGEDSGAVELYSGADFSLLQHWDGAAAGDAFGDQVADAGDVNLDGWLDVCSSSRLNDQNGDSSGMARVFSGFDGSVLYTWFGADPGDALGGGLDGAGDVDADGYDDIIVGSRWDDPSGTNSGSATVYSGFDGSAIRFFPGADLGDGLGNSVSGAGDLDQDGYEDLLAGVWLDDPNGTDSGSVIAYSGFDSSILFQSFGDHASDRMGTFVSRVGDLNHDGYEDFSASEIGSDFTASNAGAVRAFSGKDGTTLFTVYGDNAGDEIGVVMGECGDVNADGWADMISASYWNDAGGANAGTVRVYSGTVTPLASVGAGLAGTNGVPQLLAGGTLAGNSPMTLKLNEARANASASLVVGFTAINAPFKGGVMVPAPNLLVAGLPTDSHGQLLLDVVFPTGLPSGFNLYFQYWIADPAAVHGAAATNGAQGVTP